MQRITIHQAKKRFFNNELVVLCPCKCHPGRPWSMGATVTGYDAYKEEWHKSKKDTWDSMVNNWKYYNASYETGYYPHYYVEN